MFVRKFQTSDLEDVIRLANTAWKPIYRLMRESLGDNISDLMRPEGDDVTKGNTIRREILEAPENFFVCEDNGRVIGFAGCFLDRENKIGTIGHNAADKSCGIKGIGQLLYKAVLDYFRENGMKAAKVFTGLDEAHAPARRAYERAGFNKAISHVTYFMEL